MELPATSRSLSVRERRCPIAGGQAKGSAGWLPTKLTVPLWLGRGELNWRQWGVVVDQLLFAVVRPAGAGGLTVFTRGVRILRSRYHEK